MLRIRWFYLLAKRYADLFEGNNNWDFTSNGELRFMERNLSRCTTVFDIGAHVGRWTKRALRVSPNLTVHCFEPSRSNFRKLKECRFPRNVILNRTGMSSQPGRRVMFIFDRGGGGLNSLYQRYGLEQGWGIKPARRREAIWVDTADRYSRNHKIKIVDFVKIDVEGHELEVLEGMRRLLTAGRVNIIGFEYGGTYIDSRSFLKDVFEFFQDLDYDLYKVFPWMIVRVPRYDVRHENLQYQNWLAIKKGYRFLP